MNIKLSVIVPIYNTPENFLQKWYKSIFYFERIMHPAWIFKYR